MFRQLIEAAPDAMVIVGGRGQIVLINRRAASVGVALFGGGFDLTSETVLANADVAMYQAKAAGCNRVTLFEPSKSQRLELRGLDGAAYGF